MSITLIYPSDPSTKFLKEIEDSLSRCKNIDVNVIKTQAAPYTPNNSETVNTIFHTSDIIIFIGHGSKSCIYGATHDANNPTQLLSIRNGKETLKGKQFICFSCFSSTFIKEVNTIESSIGFGNLPTTWKDVEEARLNSSNAFKEQNIESIEIFKNELIKAFSLGLKYAISTDANLKSIYLYIKLFLNKAISSCSNKNINYLNAGKLLFKVREEMVLNMRGVNFR